MMPAPPPIPPHPPNFDAMPPHQRKKAEEEFERQQTEYLAQFSEYQSRQNWVLAAFIVVGALACFAAVCVAAFGAYLLAGVHGLFLLFFGCLALWCAVQWVKERLDQ